MIEIRKTGPATKYKIISIAQSADEYTMPSFRTHYGPILRDFCGRDKAERAAVWALQGQNQK
jgi:hypothetical protein